jgi:[acyl-carrier-protein] S-malonyltransferase
MDVVLLFPGQGSQKPGMGRDLADAFPAARDAFRAVDEALGVPLSRLCFEGPADELTLTHNAQPALLAHGAAAWAATRDTLAPQVRAAAGHSLGEFTAYHAAGAVPLERAARLVRQRGALMYDAGTERPGAMAAILGDTRGPIEAICERATREAGLTVPANYNSPGQVVISGEVAGVERAMELAKAAGAKRAVRLSVSGAFHSPLMRPACDGLRDALEGAGVSDAAFPIYANVNAAPTTSADQITRLLLEQLTSPVQWIAVVRGLAERHPEALYVEMGPGAVLTGLVRKIAPQLRTATCGTAAEADQLLQGVAV